MSMKNYDDAIGNRSRDFSVCSALPQPTALPRAALLFIIHRNFLWVIIIIIIIINVSVSVQTTLSFALPTDSLRVTFCIAEEYGTWSQNVGQLVGSFGGGFVHRVPWKVFGYWRVEKLELGHVMFAWSGWRAKVCGAHIRGMKYGHILCRVICGYIGETST
jgi:hypothetical protein